MCVGLDIVWNFMGSHNKLLLDEYGHGMTSYISGTPIDRRHTYTYQTAFLPMMVMDVVVPNGRPVGELWILDLSFQWNPRWKGTTNIQSMSTIVSLPEFEINIMHSQCGGCEVTVNRRQQA